MKKLLSFILVLATCLSLAACGSSDDGAVYSLGDTVSTDIYDFTLTAAEFTVAVGNTSGDSFFTPKAYDAKKDSGNPYVAPVGRTLVAFTYTVTNKNRTSDEFHKGSFVSVKYDGKSFKSLKQVDGAYFLYESKQIRGTNGKLNTYAPGQWHSCTGISNFLLGAGEKETRRGYVEISAEVTDLDAPVELTVSVPNSEGKKEKFTYVVTAADRASVAEVEVTLDMALASFSKEAGQTYFTAHREEYPVVNGEQMAQLLPEGKWQVYYTLKGIGFWSGHFWFEADGRIRDDYDYQNERTWVIEGDELILNGEKVSQMREVTPGIYVLYLEGEPYMMMQKA